jgi:hypothetical protein
MMASIELQERKFQYRPDLRRAGLAFFCDGCLAHWSFEDQSPDARYCLYCYDFLMEEAKLLPEGKKPRWVPNPAKYPNQKVIQGVTDVSPILSTLDDENFEVDKITPPADISTFRKRGRKRIALPEKKILKLASQGMGSKQIAAKLWGQGIAANYRTIARIISGQRQLVEDNNANRQRKSRNTENQIKKYKSRKP